MKRYLSTGTAARRNRAKRSLLQAVSAFSPPAQEQETEYPRAEAVYPDTEYPQADTVYLEPEYPESATFYPEYVVVEPAETLPLDAFSLTLSDIVYDQATDTFTALEEGSYRFSWSIPAAAAQGRGILITLEDDDATTLYASFGEEEAQAGEILSLEGSISLELSAGNQIVFRNRSDVPIAIGPVPGVPSYVDIRRIS